MPGKNTHTELSDVQIVQKWIIDDVVANKICPPMVKLASMHKDEHGINWGTLSADLDIVSFRKFRPQEPALLQAVVAADLQFISDAHVGTGPLSRVFILPDFKSNGMYDEFMESMSRDVVNQLLINPTYTSMMRPILKRARMEAGGNRQALLNLLKGNIAERSLAAALIVERIFKPVNFYLHVLSDEDLVDMPTYRGPVERQKVLSLGPFYMFQVINSLRTDKLVGDLNKEALYRRNTAFAAGVNLTSYAAKMQNRRKKIK